MAAIEFLSVDWGSSNLRVRLVERSGGGVLAETASDRGAAVVADGCEPDARADAFAAALADALGALESAAGRSLAGLPAVLSGMVTSSYGWCELPYAALPFPLDGSGLVSRERTAPDGRALHFLSGVRDARDVMRGEEVQLAGLFDAPEWSELREDCIVLMPGTHSKHVRVRDGAVETFKTYMTGELYALLRRHSVLRHTLGQTGGTADENGMQAFREGRALGAAEGAAGGLFRVRAQGLLEILSPDENACFLNGLLLGDELRDPLLGGSAAPIVLCAGPALSSWYAAALREAGLNERARVVPPAEVETLTARGHRAGLARHSD